MADYKQTHSLASELYRPTDEVHVVSQLKGFLQDGGLCPKDTYVAV
jgi:hypothetical protein